MFKMMKSSVVSIAAICVVGFATMQAYSKDLVTIRAAVLKVGTVNWELDTIKRNGFDKKNGIELMVQPFANNGASRVALEGGEADLAVADWIWVARQRAAGKDYVFIPYSKAVGGLVVAKDSTIKTLEDLKGKKIGIAGGPVDKSWLILQAYAKQKYGMDLAGETEQVFGAPPLIFKAGLKGEVDGVINFWHFLAKMKASGMRQLISVNEASKALGLSTDTPLLGYVMKESFIKEHPGVVKSLYAASRASKDLLGSDDKAWEPLRKRMRVKTDAQYNKLRDDFRAGIPKLGNINVEDAKKFFELMAKLGGAKLVGKATTLPDGLFANLE